MNMACLAAEIVKVESKLTSVSDFSSAWMPPNGALHGFSLDRWMALNLAVVLTLFLLAHLLLAIALVTRRRTKDFPRFWPAKSLPLLLLCGLYVWMAVTAEHLWAVDRIAGPSLTAMQIEVVGVQFQWYFHYPGEDASFGMTKAELVNPSAGNPLGIDPGDSLGIDDVVSSELVLPAGREIDLRLRAHDVIHGFFIPGMRLKQNAVPGLTLHVHFIPVTPGEYPILCTQVCGLGHGHMQALLRVVSAQEFDLWLAARERKRMSEETAEGVGR